MKEMLAVQDRLIEKMREIPVIDSHTHIVPENRQAADVLAEYTDHYLGHDLMTAGMSKEDHLKLADISIPMEERFALVKPWLKKIKNTAYYRYVITSIKAQTGMDIFDEKTLPAINEYYKKSLVQGYYNELLARNKIESVLIDHTGFDWTFGEYPACRQSYNVVHLFVPYNNELLNKIEDFSGVPIRGFDSYLDACEALLRKKVREQGVRTLKIPLAYIRELSFPQSRYSEAEEEFDTVFSGRILYRPALSSNFNFSGSPRFQNYLMHRIMPLAEELDLTAQFHTGHLAGLGNYLPNSKPEGLIPLFSKYPGVRFDLFHMSYPYQSILGAISKNYPNVFVNLCWAHIISPTAVVASLTELLETLPANKIIGFGSDVQTAGLIIGSLEMARQNIAEALSTKVVRGLMDEDDAGDIALMLMYRNPKAIYKL